MLNKLTLHCLKYAESVLAESMVFDGGSKEKYLPISFVIYLIEVENRKIIVDAGCNTMPGFNMKKFYSPAFVLRRANISPAEITDVIITHSHHDHIHAVNHFKNAIIHISKNEYEKGAPYIAENIKVNLFENEYVINPQIRIIEIGGHSKGSSIVEIKSDDKIHILSGDECYSNENIENKICTGAFFNKEKSMEFIKEYSNKKYRVHTCHDISLKTERII